MDRAPVGLTLSAAVAALVIGLVFAIGRVGGAGMELIVHAAAGICLISAIFAWVKGTGPVFEPAEKKGAGTFCQNGPKGALHKRFLTPFSARIGANPLYVASLTAGVLATMLMLFTATIEILARTILFSRELWWQIEIWPSGLLDIAAVATALALSHRCLRQPQLITAMFWSLVLAALWVSLQVPSSQPLEPTGAHRVPTLWAAVLMAGGAAVVAVFTVGGTWLDMRRRFAAVPHAPGELAAGPTLWPGFQYSAGAVAAAVLILGTIYVALPWTAASALLAGVAVLTLAHRRWNESLADAGLALISLAIVSLGMLGLKGNLWSPEVFETLLARAVIGLAAMSRFWYWLARVWDQQLDEGRAWTTAGRLIRPARRVAYLLAATAVLLALHLAFWPRWPHVLLRETSGARWAWGLSAHAILLMALLGSLRGTSKTTLGWLAIFAAASAVTFGLVRAPTSVVGQWWALHWPVGFAAIGLLSVLLAAAIRPDSRLRALREPLIISGVLFAPMLAMAGAAMISQFRIPPGTSAVVFALLSAVYLVAARRPGPEKFRILSVLCAAAGLSLLSSAFGPTALPTLCVYVALLGLALLLVALLWPGRPVGPAARWAGSLITLAALLLGVFLRGR